MIDQPLDEDLERLREHGYAVIDEMIRYFETIRDVRVLSSAAPGDVARELPMNERPAPFDALLQHYRDVILPGVTHWNHPRFFAYFSITGSGAGILGELLSATLNVNGMLWKTSPAATEVEEKTLSWLAENLGLPASWFGVINDTASINTFLALAAAREATGLEIRTRGMSGRDLPVMRVYCSEHAHSSVDKAAIALGLGIEGVSRIPADDQFRMDPARLTEAVERDVRDGVRPIAVVPTLGTTSTGAIDPLPAIVEIAREHRMWIHADAAYGGAVGLVEESRRAIWQGIEAADSLVFNPHKWLFTPIDCSLLYTRRPDVLRQTFSLVPEYLRTSEENVTNFMDYGLQLGRRFRALKLWLVLGYYGIERLAGRIRDHLEYAERLAHELREIEDVEVVSQSLSVVVFRRVVRDGDEIDDEASDAATQWLLDAMNGSGECFVSHTRLRDRLVIRVAIGNGRTVWSDVAVVTRLARELR